ncbi:uncharacterized protein LOC141885899 [Acropora palmata]|uniref:uncharacterized protein LOC141885899 n=1 Tax=Acropora palmata TaxID=6131 RepID=UPI003DA023C8
MLAFSYLGLLSRTILTALHFNWNLNRESLKDGQGNAKLHVTYPKFQEGEGTVREACVKQNYDYIAKIYETLVKTPKEELQRLEDELKAEVPEPLHNMLKDKESKAEAMEKFLSRKKRETNICPPTCSDAELQQLQNPAWSSTGQKGSQKAPTCKRCGHPRKGHKKGQCSSTTVPVDKQ